jgi:hypothetical protein
MAFYFHAVNVRVMMMNGEPWFVAQDVCRVLGLSAVDVALRRLDSDEKGACSIRTPGGPQEMSTISESGLYALIFTSQKPEAKSFRKWVTAELLPRIRKTGYYYTGEDRRQPVAIGTTVIARCWRSSDIRVYRSATGAPLFEARGVRQALELRRRVGSELYRNGEFYDRATVERLCMQRWNQGGYALLRTVNQETLPVYEAALEAWQREQAAESAALEESSVDDSQQASRSVAIIRYPLPGEVRHD